LAGKCGNWSLTNQVTEYTLVTEGKVKKLLAMHFLNKESVLEASAMLIYDGLGDVGTVSNLILYCEKYRENSAAMLPSVVTEFDR